MYHRRVFIGHRLNTSQDSFVKGTCNNIGKNTIIINLRIFLIIYFEERKLSQITKEKYFHV